MDQTLKGQDRTIEKLPVLFLLAWGISFGFVWLGVRGEGCCWFNGVLLRFFWFVFYYGFFQFGLVFFFGGVIFVTANNFTFPVNLKTEKHLLK